MHFDTSKIEFTKEAHLEHRVNNIHKLVLDVLGLKPTEKGTHIEGLLDNNLFSNEENRDLIRGTIEKYIRDKPTLDYQEILDKLNKVSKDTKTSLLHDLRTTGDRLHKAIGDIVHYLGIFKNSHPKLYDNMKDAFRGMMKQMKIVQIKNIINRCKKVPEKSLFPLFNDIVSALQKKIHTLNEILELKRKSINLQTLDLPEDLSSDVIIEKDLLDNLKSVPKEEREKEICINKVCVKIDPIEENNIQRVINTCKKSMWQIICKSNYPTTYNILAKKFGRSTELPSNLPNDVTITKELLNNLNTNVPDDEKNRETCIEKVCIKPGTPITESSVREFIALCKTHTWRYICHNNYPTIYNILLKTFGSYGRKI